MLVTHHALLQNLLHYQGRGLISSLASNETENDVSAPAREEKQMYK